jgi:four helix bundle suffix protein
MVELLEIPVPDRHFSIYDPAAGTGGMLSVSKEHLLDRASTPEEKERVEKFLTVHGQELSPTNYAVCQADLLIKNDRQAKVTYGNSLIPHDPHSKEPGDQWQEGKYSFKRNRMTDAHRAWVEERYFNGWAKGHADEQVKMFRREDFVYHKVGVVLWQTDEKDQPAVITEPYEKNFSAANVAKEQEFYCAEPRSSGREFAQSSSREDQSRLTSAATEINFLRPRGCAEWDKNSKEALFVRKLGSRKGISSETFREFIEIRPGPVVANIIISLIHQTNYLLDQQLRRLEQDFLRDGGLRERMTRARLAARAQNRNTPP